MPLSVIVAGPRKCALVLYPLSIRDAEVALTRYSQSFEGYLLFLRRENGKNQLIGKNTFSVPEIGPIVVELQPYEVLLFR